MTGPSSSSNPSQLPILATAVSPENGEEAAGVVRTSPPSISLLRPPIPTSEVWFLTYFSCSSCLLGRIRSILSVAMRNRFGHSALPAHADCVNEGSEVALCLDEILTLSRVRRISRISIRTSFDYRTDFRILHVIRVR
ncbi:hypothetical protein L3X38_043416 [Prunus dulcis]|uniref:Uncharacterized protein n=1 Tax=Prunus dulcis TaxID=3755 RepID=A0AAD4UWP1_PRUDU|nr:hypothetical protein L3X38_043416 [Prunus dulcis]